MSTQPIPRVRVGENSDALAGMTQLLTETYGWDPTDALEVEVGPSKKSAMMAPRWTAIRIPPGTKL